MIGFRRQTLWERFRYAVDRKYREGVDQRRKEALRYLMQHPEAPCLVGDMLIPDGYGNNCLRDRYLDNWYL